MTDDELRSKAQRIAEHRMAMQSYETDPDTLWLKARYRSIRDADPPKGFGECAAEAFAEFVVKVMKGQI